MGVQNLQIFLEGGYIEGSVVPVELLSIARNLRGSKTPRQRPYKKLALVIDGENCLDRLYGGFYSDWVSGGQWCRMFQFLSTLIDSCQTNNVDLTVALNGAFESERMSEWIQKQIKDRAKASQILRHLRNKGTPPPKVWWIPPVFISTALKYAIKYNNKITVMCTLDDHHKEVIAYCRGNNLHGIVGDDPEYIVFDPPRYFSGSALKLTRKGQLETKEYMIGDLVKGLELTTEQLCVVAALLGNHLLHELQLGALHTKMGINPAKNTPDVTLRAIANFVKNLNASVDNIEELADQIFDSIIDKNSKKRSLFIQSVQYYQNGTKQGFVKQKPKKFNLEEEESAKNNAPKENNEMDCSKFASETPESVAESMVAYSLVAENLNLNTEVVIDEVDEENRNGRSASPANDEAPSTSSSNGGSEIVESRPKVNITPKPHICTPEILKMARDRHQKGLMIPFVYHVLHKNEVKLPVLLEEESVSREFPSIHVIYRPVRQMVYAILFNLHHKMFIVKQKQEAGESVEPVGDIVIKEWLWSVQNPYNQPEPVKAVPLGWAVPTIQRLWFGAAEDDKRRRLRAFLTCMKSDNPRMVCPTYVPEHLLLVACVLRYLLQVKPPILRRCELDAFIVTVFSPDLTDCDFTQEMQLQNLTVRGVTIATLFMQGIETAVLVNDACGAPIPALMCCPWLFFDGKLFQYILSKTDLVNSLEELCGRQRLNVLVKVERMRIAILDGLDVDFAWTLPVPSFRLPLPTNYGPASDHLRRGTGRRPVSTSGGKLEVAGMVVGSWGPNYGSGRGRILQPLGGLGRGRILPNQGPGPGFGRARILHQQFGPPRPGGIRHTINNYSSGPSRRFGPHLNKKVGKKKENKTQKVNSTANDEQIEGTASNDVCNDQEDANEEEEELGLEAKMNELSVEENGQDSMLLD